MPKIDLLPPPLLGTAKLLEYAIVDDSVVFTYRQNLFVDGTKLGPVPCIGLCQDFGNSRFYIYYCDENWNVLAVTGCGTITDLKRKAEYAYNGILMKWIKSPYTEDQIIEYTNKKWGRFRCSFCHKWPWQVRQIFNRFRSRICNECVHEFSQMLDKDK